MDDEQISWHAARAEWRRPDIILALHSQDWPKPLVSPCNGFSATSLLSPTLPW
jgi:hypothetical protein